MIDNRDFKVITGKRVSAHYHQISESDIRLMIIVDNEKPHIFEKSRIENKLILEMELKAIEERFQNGTFVFLNGQLLDYRIDNKDVYVKTADEMKVMADILGIEVKNPNKKDEDGNIFNDFRKKTLNKDIYLGGEGKIFDLKIDSLGNGGNFENKLVHRWSPFDKNVTISLETERLICRNGMVGMSPYVTKKVPIVNRVAEHLDLVSVQIAPNINALLKERFTTMATQPASVGSMLTAHSLLKERLKSNNDSFDNEERRRLSDLKSLVDVKTNLNHIYEPSVFENKEISYDLKANLTQYDLFNVLTETSSHTNGDADNNVKIQKNINRLVFDELSDKKSVQGKVPLSDQSDHRRAFFGKDKGE